MGTPRFFKLPEHKRFTYKPLYYNPEKEEREERNRQIARELGLKQDEVYVTRIGRGSFKSHIKKKSSIRSTSNIRLILIFIALSFIAYLIFYR